MRSGYYSPSTSDIPPDKSAHRDMNIQDMNNPGLARNINIQYRNMNSQKSLGILYQNRNGCVGLGDIQGVKGDPSENINRKGIFEHCHE